MEGFFVMVKMNLKILLRNKGFLVCIILVPLLAVSIMNIGGGFANTSTNKDNKDFLEWTGNKDVIEIENLTMSLKVYDRSRTSESNTLLHKLADTGLYKIYLVNETSKEYKLSEKAVMKEARNTLESCSIQAILDIPEDFVKAGKINNIITIIHGYEDSRLTLLQDDITWYCNNLNKYITSQDGETTLSKNVSLIHNNGGVVLTKKQQDYRSAIGYALSFLIVSFVFSGVFIVGILIKEKDNKAYDRMKLSMMTARSYILTKVVLILLTSIIQVVVFDIGLRITGRTEFGVPYYAFLGMILLMGILFNLISLIIGTLLGNLIGVTFTSFVIWSATSLMAGMYFPVTEGSMLERISAITPQRWFMKSCEAYMLNESNASLKFLCAFFTFAIILLTVGMISLRTNERE